LVEGDCEGLPGGDMSPTIFRRREMTRADMVPTKMIHVNVVPIKMILAHVVPVKNQNLQGY